MKNMLIRIGYPYNTCLFPFIGFLISVAFFYVVENPRILFIIVVFGAFFLFMYILGYVWFMPEREDKLKKIKEKKHTLKEKIINQNRKTVLVGEILMKDDTYKISDLEMMHPNRLEDILHRIKK